MKKKLLTLVALSCFLVAGMLFASPAAAFSGVSGIIIDSRDSDPWQLGAEIWVFNQISGEICATAVLPTGSGTFNIPINGSVDDLGFVTGSCVGGTNNGQAIEVYIDFQCQQGIGTCGTLFPPAPGDASYVFIQNALPTVRNAGYIETNTGPTAVTLSGFDASTGFNANYAIAALVLALGGVSVFALRRRNVQA